MIARRTKKIMMIGTITAVKFAPKKTIQLYVNVTNRIDNGDFSNCSKL